jgi:hypothetical protein
MTLLIAKTLMKVTCGALTALAVVVAVSSFRGTTVGRADSPGSPVWIGNGIAAYQSCSNWKNATATYPGSNPPVAFNYYWSGQPQWWNNSAAHVCWHNDEIGNSWWRALDIPITGGTSIVYSATINAAGLTPGQLFTASGCNGVDVAVWTPNGAFAGNVHYWQMRWRNSSLFGTGSVNSYYYPTQTIHTQYLGDVGGPGETGCTTTGAHLHQAVLQGGWAQPTVNDSVATVTRHPSSFGW